MALPHRQQALRLFRSQSKKPGSLESGFFHCEDGGCAAGR
jgi:hypothetical protein